MGFKFWGLGFGVQGFWGLGFKFSGLGLGFKLFLCKLGAEDQICFWCRAFVIGTLTGVGGKGGGGLYFLK